MSLVHLLSFLVLVFAVGNEGLLVLGPSGPLMAKFGGSVLLPCFLENPLSLEGLQVEWRRKDSNSLVSLLQKGKNRPDLQSQEFRDRADFFPDEIPKGNFSILLTNVVQEDTGVYRCQVNTTQDTGEVMMEIKDIKHFMVTGSDQPVFAREGDDVILNCSVDSHVAASEIEEVTWKKADRDQDVLVLLYQDGEIFPDSSHERYQGRVDLFSSEIPKGNFSLKLKNVKMEDKGEFVCAVHTSDASAHTSVLLQGVGFSALHITILLLCCIAILLTVGFCGPVFILRKTRDFSKKGMKRQIPLILCPNICLFISFCLWSQEGFLTEVISCSVVNILRPVLLMKACLFLDILPTRLQKTVKSMALPLYHSTLTMTAGSMFVERLSQVQIESGYIITLLAVVVVVIAISAAILAAYALRIHLTVCLEIFNLALFGILLSRSNSNFDYSYKIPSVIAPQITMMLMVLLLQRHLFQGKPFRCVHLCLSSIIVTLFSISHICVYILLSITEKDFTKGWILVFVSVTYILALLGVIYLLRWHRGRRKVCCSQWRKIGYLCCAVLVALLITAIAAVSFHYLYVIMEDKDRTGYLALLVMAHVLTATCLFKHPEHLPDSVHFMVYMFGAVGLSTVNAIVLATELILKAGKGARTIEDLRVIVLPLETLFLFAWLTLQIYDAWLRDKDRTKLDYADEREKGPERSCIKNVVQEMEVLSDSNLNLE